MLELQNENSKKRIILDDTESFKYLNVLKLKKEKQIKVENQLDNLLLKIRHTTLDINQLDNYANTIPLGSFCFAISFILYGFYECKVHKKEDRILYTTILLFGGVGQITAGFFEYIKCRTYLCTLYITYGLYFLSFFMGKYYKSSYFNTDCQKIFYGTWACLTFPIYIISFKSNIFFSIQNLTSVAYFVVKCIGVWSNIDVLKGIVSGILELISGFCSLYICFGQILNEHFRFPIFPAIPFQKENDIDDIVSEY